MEYYVIPTRTIKSPISQAIYFVSRFALAQHEYTHVHIARNYGLDSRTYEVIDQTFPHVIRREKVSFEGRSFARIYRIKDEAIGQRAWQRAEADHRRKRGYAVGQLISMVWSVVTGKRPLFRKGMVCSEAVANWVYGSPEPWMEILTVGRVVEQMQKDGLIEYVREIKN